MAMDEKIKRIQDEGHIVPDHSIIKTPDQIAGIRQSAKINIAVLDYVAEHIKEGITTQQIDDWVYGRNSRTVELSRLSQERVYIHQ